MLAVVAALAAAAAGAAVLLDGGEGEAPLAAPPEFYGVNAQLLFATPRDGWAPHLRAMAKAGLKAVRSDAPWEGAEPNAPEHGRHTYVWSGFDRQVEALARHGLRWYPILDYSTNWSGEAPGDLFTPPARVGDYTAYATAFARRYGRGGAFWREHQDVPSRPVVAYEIWNEPNSRVFWHPQGRAPERYAELYAATRDVLHAVDPDARVVAGGLASAGSGTTAPSEFLRRMYRHLPKVDGRVDAVGLHPYAPELAGVYDGIRDFRHTLESLGAGGVPIDLTEIGWTTVHTPERRRAAMLAELARDLPRSNCGIARLMPHTWIGDERDRDNPEHWFGIYELDARPKPAGAAYATAVDRVAASGLETRIEIC